MKRNYSFVGALLIAVGAIILVLRMFGYKFFEIDTYDFWVFFVLLLGISFELGFFLTGRNPGLLVPGGIVTTIGLLFMFEVSTNWHFAEYTWPVYILSVSVGLLQMYLFSGRKKGLLIAGLIVGGTAAIFMAFMILHQITSIIKPGVFIPISLIAAGIAIFFSGASKKAEFRI